MMCPLSPTDNMTSFDIVLVCLPIDVLSSSAHWQVWRDESEESAHIISKDREIWTINIESTDGRITILYHL